MFRGVDVSDSLVLVTLCVRFQCLHYITVCLAALTETRLVSVAASGNCYLGGVQRVRV